MGERANSSHARVLLVGIHEYDLILIHSIEDNFINKNKMEETLIKEELLDDSHTEVSQKERIKDRLYELRKSKYKPANGPIKKHFEIYDDIYDELNSRTSTGL